MDFDQVIGEGWILQASVCVMMGSDGSKPDRSLGIDWLYGAALRRGPPQHESLRR